MRTTIFSARSVAAALIAVLSLAVAGVSTAGATSPLGLTAKQRVASDAQTLFGSAAGAPSQDPRDQSAIANIAATDGNCEALILSRSGKLVT